MNTLGSRLKSLRVENDFTLDYVAKELGTTKVSIGRYEKDEREPRAEMLIMLAKLYDVSTDYLLGISKDKKPKSTIFDGNGGISQNLNLIGHYMLDKNKLLSDCQMELLKKYLDVLYDGGKGE